MIFLSFLCFQFHSKLLSRGNVVVKLVTIRPVLH